MVEPPLKPTLTRAGFRSAQFVAFLPSTLKSFADVGSIDVLGERVPS